MIFSLVFCFQALPAFSLLLNTVGKSDTSEQTFSLIKFIELGGVVAAVFALSFGPFLYDVSF